MERELAIELIISSRETRSRYNAPLFSKEDAQKLLAHFDALDIHLAICNSMQKTSCYIEKNRCLLYDTGITEYFSFLNCYIDNNSEEQLFDGIILRLFAESFLFIGEPCFSELLLNGYHYYDDKLLAGLNADSYKYLASQELFIIAHELSHEKIKHRNFKLSDALTREERALITFQEVAENRIKVSRKWSEIFMEILNDTNSKEEFICDSLAIRAMFSINKIELKSVYFVAGAIISAIFSQYIISSIDSDARFAYSSMNLLEQNKNDLDNFQLEYPAHLADLGMYLVIRYGYVRFCINTICRDFGISYEDMKLIDDYTHKIGERYNNLFLKKNEASENILGLFYDYRHTPSFAISPKESRRNSKEIFFAQTHRYNDWLSSMNCPND